MEWDPSSSMLIPGALSQCPCPAYCLPVVSSAQTVILHLRDCGNKIAPRQPGLHTVTLFQKPQVCE